MNPVHRRKIIEGEDRVLIFFEARHGFGVLVPGDAHNVIIGVQAAHYDRHEYTKEKRATLVKWERYLKRITSGEEEKKVVSFAEAKGTGE